MGEKIELKLIIDGKEAITTLNLTDENLKKLVTGFDRVRGASQKSSLDIAAAWGSVTLGINQAVVLAERFYGVISAPIKVAGQFEQYETQLKVMLGSAEAAKQRLEELQEFAATTPFTLPQVVAAGNQLQAMQKYSIETIRQLGDLAAASGKPFDQVMNAYAKLVSGQKGIAIDMFRDLLITSKDWAKATSAHFSKNGEISASAEEMAAALPKILKEKGFDGMMAEQAKTLNGMISNMEDAFTKLLNQIGNKYLGTFKLITTGLTEITNSMIEVKTNVDQVRESAYLQRAEFEQLSQRYLDLAINTHRTTAEHDVFKKTIKELNEKYPALISNINLEKAGYEDAKIAIDNFRSSLLAKKELDLRVAGAQDLAIQRTKLQSKEYALISEKSAHQAAEKLKKEELASIDAPLFMVSQLHVGTKELLGKIDDQIIIVRNQIQGIDNDIKRVMSDPEIARLVDEINKAGQKPKKNSNVGGDIAGKNDGAAVRIFNLKELAEFEKKLHEEKLTAIQQSEEAALAIIRSHNDQEFTLRRNHAKATITDKQQLEAVLAAIDKEELDRKKQLLTDQLSEIKTNTTLEKDERELKEQELLTAITTVEEQILDIKIAASNKAIDQAEREAEYRKQTMKQIVGDTGSLFGQMYTREQESTRREIDAEKKRRTESVETERRKRLEHAVTQQEKDRINREYDTRLKQMEEQYEQRQKEAGAEMFYMQQHMAAVQALINTYEAATKAYAQGGAIFGPPLAAMITALGLAQVAMIESQELPGYAAGGLIPGGNQAIQVNEEGQEYIVNADATSRYINVLDAINNNRELRLPVAQSNDSELLNVTKLLLQENKILNQRIKAFSRPQTIKAGIDKYETAAIFETAETFINKRKA